MLKIIVAAILVIVAIVLVLAARKPDAMDVSRSLVIAAAPEQITPFIEDFKRWQAWSPYEKLDTDLQREYTGAERGVGAVYRWSGKKAGAGRMEITNAEPTHIRIAVDFEKPMKTSNRAEFALEPQGSGTRVTWTMHAPMPFVSKIASVFMDLDQLIGSDFEKGLATLKQQSEQAPPSPAALAAR